MNSKLKLSSSAILNRKFDANVKGYDAEQVDLFLDEILSDYQIIEAFLKKEYGQLKAKEKDLETAEHVITDLELKIAAFRKQLEVLDKNNKPSVNLSNLELHKRINALEKALYKLGVDPTKLE